MFELSLTHAAVRIVPHAGHLIIMSVVDPKAMNGIWQMLHNKVIITFLITCTIIKIK